MARRRSPLKKALRAMAPHRVLWRAMSGPEVASAIRSKTRTQTVRVTAQTRQAQVQRAAKQATKKTAAAKKTAAGKADPYAVALAIPGQNRQAAAKLAKATAPKKAAPMSERVLRGEGGRLAGSRPALNAEDQAAYQRAKGGYVDPQLQARGLRRR